MFDKEIILASASPRRTEILSLAKIKHRIIVKEHEEIIDNSKTPEEIVKNLAYQKAYAVYKEHVDEIVLGADTVVVLDEILGKPKDRDDAFRMLKKLSNTTHKVITGVALST
jgi:septum formation protein